MHSYTHKLNNRHPLVSAILNVKRCVINLLCSDQGRTYPRAEGGHSPPPQKKKKKKLV